MVMNDTENAELKKEERQQVVELGSDITKTPGGNIYTLTIIGQVEGHQVLPETVKTTKYEHVLPLLAGIEESDEIDGLLLLLNTVGGDIEAGLAIAPLAEEIVFRGAILRSLLKWTSRHWLAIALSALCFALVHANPAQMPHAFLVGLLLGWMYYRTGSIIPCVTYHWVNNSVAYIMCNMMPDPDIPLIVFFNGSERAVIVALLSSLCIFIPSVLQLNLRMKKG